MENKIPSWIKLDNAAIIYPSTLSRKFAAMFRMSVTFRKKIDIEILNIALKNIMNRFPSFSYELKYGFFWCYFKHIDNEPIIQEDYRNPLLRIDFKKNNYYMFRVRTFDKTVSCEYFHALTDGTGGIIFLMTLVGEYLRLSNKINIKYNDLVLNPNDNPNSDEYSDSFMKYARKIGGLSHEEAAYHQKGTKEDNNVLNIITGTIPIDKLKLKAKEYNATITEFLVAVMIEALQEIQEQERKRKKKPIKISVPVNLRKIYSTKTLRNFSSYVNVKVDTKYGHYSFDEIINEVKCNMKYLTTEKRINAKITGNVLLANNYFVRLLPMFIKKYVLSISEALMGDRYCSSTFSNIGLLNIPKEMENYIDKASFILGKSRGKPCSCGAISIKNNLYISFSRTIKEADYERLFFTKLVEMNIPVEIESNGGR